MNDAGAQPSWSLHDIPVGSCIAIISGRRSVNSWLVRALIARFSSECRDVTVFHDAEMARPFYSKCMSPGYIHYRVDFSKWLSGGDSRGRLLAVDCVLEVDDCIPELLQSCEGLTSIFTGISYDRTTRAIRDTADYVFTNMVGATTLWHVHHKGNVGFQWVATRKELEFVGVIDIDGECCRVRRQLFNELVSVPAGRFGMLLPDGGVEYQRQMERLTTLQHGN